MAQRPVRFEELLPPRIREDLENEGPLPLFSPSQVAPGRQTVLHSMFSPTFGSDKENVSPSVAKTAAKSNLSRMHYSPSPIRTATGASSIHTTTNAGPRDVFLSPAHTMTSSLGGGSPFSAITRSTQQSNVSYKSLPKIEMLSLDFIQSCDSVSTLQQIVTVLSTEQQSYPSLLRVAKERLADVRQAKQRKHPSRDHVIVESSAAAATASPSTLNMSLSTDDDMNSLDIAPMPQPPSQQQPHPPPYNHSNNDVLASSSHQKSSSSRREEQLYEEVQRLTQTLKDMEREQTLEQGNFWNKIQALEEHKNVTEENIRNLQQIVSASGQATQELVQALEAMREENVHLQNCLDKERQERERQNKQAQELQERLTARVKELTKQLLQAKDGTEQKKNKELNLLLRSSQRNLQEIKNERDAMLQAILDVSATTVRDIQKLSKPEREKRFKSSIAKMASNKGALKAMAETLKDAEKDRSNLVKAQRHTQSLLEQTEEANRRLKRDNLSLTREIEHLSKGISASRAYADELLRSAQVQYKKKWEEREAKYQKVIGNLKKKIRTQESMVSPEVYKSAVAKAQAKTAEAEDQKKKVERLTTKVTQLQWQLNDSRRRPVATSSTPNPTKNQQRAAKKISPESNTITRATKNPKTPSQPPSPRQERKVSFVFSPVASSKNQDRSKVRASIVRAAGGRKGLQEQLKQARSPKTPRMPLKARN